jgi:hypothetical protein
MSRLRTDLQRFREKGNEAGADNYGLAREFVDNAAHDPRGIF